MPIRLEPNETIIIPSNLRFKTRRRFRHVSHLNSEIFELFPNFVLDLRDNNLVMPIKNKTNRVQFIGSIRRPFSFIFTVDFEDYLTCLPPKFVIDPTIRALTVDSDAEEEEDEEEEDDEEELFSDGFPDDIVEI